MVERGSLICNKISPSMHFLESDVRDSSIKRGGNLLSC